LVWYFVIDHPALSALVIATVLGLGYLAYWLIA
jgi:hypothetical protein